MKSLNKILFVVLLGPAVCSAQGGKALPRLRVSDNKRFLATADGKPFFYLADTGWELLHRLDQEAGRDVSRQTCVPRLYRDSNGRPRRVGQYSDPNAQGDLPLIDKDPTKPAVTSGANPSDAAAYDYWDHVDYIVDQANARSLYIAMLPSWGRWVNNTAGGTRVFSPRQRGRLRRVSW